MMVRIPVIFHDLKRCFNKYMRPESQVDENRPRHIFKRK